MSVRKASIFGMSEAYRLYTIGKLKGSCMQNEMNEMAGESGSETREKMDHAAV